MLNLQIRGGSVNGQLTDICPLTVTGQLKKLDDEGRWLLITADENLDELVHCFQQDIITINREWPQRNGHFDHRSHGTKKLVVHHKNVIIFVLKINQTLFNNTHKKKKNS